MTNRMLRGRRRVRRTLHPPLEGATLRSLLPLVLVVAALACGDSAGEVPDAFVVRDSAGIRIAESAAPLWGEGEGWRLAAEPSVEIGVAEGQPEYLLANVRDARRLPNGGIIIANSGSGELRYYDSSGRHLRSVGRRGEGPGEFNAIDWLHLLPGDSLLAHDPRLGRLSTFTGEGQYVRSATLADRAEVDRPRAVAAFADGSLLAEVEQHSTVSGTARPEVDRIPLAFMHFSRMGVPLDSIAILPGAQMITAESAPLILSVEVFLGPSAVAAVGANRVYLGTNETFEIGVYTPDGHLEGLIRRLGPLRPVPAEEVHRIRTNFAEDEPMEELRSALREIVARMPIPDSVPAYEAMIVDAAGNLWVEETRIAEEEEAPRWMVFDEDRRLLGTLELPHRFRALHIGEDFVLGVVNDELDVQRVRMYRLEKPGRL